MKIPELRRLNLDALIVLKGVLSLVRDPTQTDSVYDIEDGLKHSEAMAVATKYMLAQPEVAAMARERYLSITSAQYSRAIAVS
jgi:ubiquinone biosynthesis protein COQ4